MTRTEANQIEAVIQSVFESADVCPGSSTNLVDVVYLLSNSTRAVATAIVPPVQPGTDAAGNHIESLTEAVMGVTSGLCRIAEAIEKLAEAVDAAK
jgi:hypothetical protein